jgi:hypothetical protein
MNKFVAPVTRENLHSFKLFKVIEKNSVSVVGSIYRLAEDDGSKCPWFTHVSGPSNSLYPRPAISLYMLAGIVEDQSDANLALQQAREALDAAERAVALGSAGDCQCWECARMSAHTPGPWLFFATDGINVGVTTESADIAHCHGFYKPRRSWNEEVANAKLMAASPDLLEALREAVEFADQDYQCLTPTGRKMVDGWKAAIAKAEGNTE